MITLFQKKSQSEVLQKRFEKLLKEAYHLSKTNRQASDAKHAEAEELLKQMESMASSK